MTLPNFVLVGTMKSGTTTIKEYLREHPDVFMYPREIHFFDEEKFYLRGREWYESLFADASNQPAIIDKTPSYSYNPVCAPRMYELLPNAKLIWIFREPVSRAYSNYWHSASRGWERLSFEDAIRRERERYQQDIYRGYLRRSIYAEQVERFLDYYRKQEMLFLLFEDLKSRPEAVLAELCKFLGVEQDKIRTERDRRNNVTSRPWSRRVEWAARRAFGERLPYRVIHRINKRPSTGYPQLDPSLKRELKAFFVPHNRLLGDLIERDLSVWD